MASYRGRRDYEPRAPKPFDFVPIAPVKRAETVGHEQFRPDHHSGELVYEAEALTHIFVASGTYALGEDAGFPKRGVIRTCYRLRGRPAIPGSSMKGVVRSVAEAVTGSCITVTREDMRRMPGGKETLGGCEPGRACPACSVFGRLGRMSKVSFGDALALKGVRTKLYRLPSLYRPRAREARRVYTDERGEFKGRKFYYHGEMAEDPRNAPVQVVPRGSRFNGSLQFENLTPDELALLLFALALDGSFALKLGGGKPACLGSLRIVPQSLELLDIGGFTRAERTAASYTGDELDHWILDKIRTVERRRDYILPEQASELRRILAYPGERECPAGMY